MHEWSNALALIFLGIHSDPPRLDARPVGSAGPLPPPARGEELRLLRRLGGGEEEAAAVGRSL